MVLADWNEEVREEPAATNAEMHLAAFDDLLTWLPLSQERLAQVVGISTSTVMAWRREPHVRPRHRNAQTLIRLWAAVASAREELGDERTLRLLAEGPQSVIGVRQALPAEEIIERLNLAAERASDAALDEAWGAEGDWEDPAAHDIAAGEMALGHAEGPEPDHM